MRHRLAPYRRRVDRAVIALSDVDLAALAPRPKAAGPRAVWEQYTTCLRQHGPRLFEEFEITTPLRLAHLMATWAHESGGFTILWENLNYTTPERIVAIFGPKHSAKVTLEEAQALVGQPEALAERVYGLGNPRKARELGNRAPGDGYKYRGFGIQQITGRADHERLLKAGCSALSATRAALQEWREKGCNELADADDVLGVRKAINGGTNGLIEVGRLLKIAKRVFTDSDFVDGDSADAEPAAIDGASGISTTKRAAEIVGGTSTAELTTELPAAVAKAAEIASDAGRPPTAADVLMALAQSPLFWMSLISLLSAAYIWFERHRKQEH